VYSLSLQDCSSLEGSRLKREHNCARLARVLAHLFLFQYLTRELYTCFRLHGFAHRNEGPRLHDFVGVLDRES